jgi:hypothetical protein
VLVTDDVGHDAAHQTHSIPWDEPGRTATRSSPAEETARAQNGTTGRPQIRKMFVINAAVERYHRPFSREPCFKNGASHRITSHEQTRRHLSFHAPVIRFPFRHKTLRFFRRQMRALKEGAPQDRWRPRCLETSGPSYAETLWHANI